MSEYGYLVCSDCRVVLDLGKAVKAPDGPVSYYQIGDQEPNWQMPDVSRALWKMLADHTGHCLRPIRESSPEYEAWLADEEATGGYTVIGGDKLDDVPFADYLAGWPG
jgi:hypothetical protein